MNTSDFLSFAKDIERENVEVEISQEINGNITSYPFELVCRLETQQLAVFKVTGNNLDYNLDSKRKLSFSVAEDEMTMPAGTFIFDRHYIIVKYDTIKLSAKDTKPDESENRRNTRFKIQKELKAKVELSSLRINEKVVAILLDLSQSGAALLLQEKHAYPLQPGDDIAINKIAGDRIEMLEGSVVHKRLVDEDNKHYQVAIQFTNPLKMTKVLSLVKLCKASAFSN